MATYKGPTVYSGMISPKPAPFDSKAAMEELERIRRNPNFLPASNKRRVGLDLTPAEKQTLAMSEQLEARIAAHDRANQKPPELPASANPAQRFISPQAADIERISDNGQRINAARARVAELQNDLSSAYWDASHPNHASAVTEVTGLSSIAFPEKSPTS